MGYYQGNGVKVQMTADASEIKAEVVNGSMLHVVQTTKQTVTTKNGVDGSQAQPSVSLSSTLGGATRGYFGGVSIFVAAIALVWLRVYGCWGKKTTVGYTRIGDSNLFTETKTENDVDVVVSGGQATKF